MNVIIINVIVLSGVKPIGRGAGYGQGVPSLSTNFIKSGEMSSNQCTLKIHVPKPVVSTTPVSQNGTVHVVRTEQMSHYTNYFQPSYPTHVQSYPTT